jgi:ubiquinone/menaquinone biosynthesis C-methylase UbiE
MSRDLTYKDYVGDEAHMAAYAEYQRKYSHQIRESDRKLIALIARHVGDGRGMTLLDIGCSTGNLLRHLRHTLPQLQLEGADIVASIIAANTEAPDLKGIRFSVLNMLEMPADRQFDVVVANAALPFFNEEEFERAIENLGRCVKRGGLFAVFDFFHPFDELITVIERSKAHPLGMKSHFRSYIDVRRAVLSAGLEEPEFDPWIIPVDLPRPSDPADMTSYTVRLEDGERLLFRGAVYQPWCHMTALRP